MQVFRSVLYWVRQYWIAYALAALVIMLPLMLPGYIFALDMIFVPRLPWPEEVGNSYAFHAVLHMLNLVVPADVLQKVILFGILVLSGVGVHQLVVYLLGEYKPGNKASVYSDWQSVVPYIGGLFYMVNPFVYGRFMTGQYAVLLGYALLSFFVIAFLRFLQRPSWRESAVMTIWIVAISVVSVHTLGLAAVFALVATALALWYRHDRTYLATLLRQGLFSILSVAIISSYWLVPTLLGSGEVAEAVGGFDETHRQAFATDGGLLAVLQLQGFWAEAQGLFKPAGMTILSGLAQLAFWVLLGLGFVKAWQKQRQVALLFGVSGILAAGLALGASFNTWLAEFVPFFAGYREPHKFVGLLALSFAVLAAYGGIWLLTRAKREKSPIWLKRYGITGMLLLLPWGTAPAMIWGFAGQLRPAPYPADWYTINRQLNDDTDNFKVLFLPWHQYMYFDFAGRIIANPADKFFNKTVIASNDPEFAGITPTRTDKTKQQINGDILPAAPSAATIGTQLAPLGIKYILLAKEGEYEEYQYLNKQNDLQLQAETAHLKLYRNTTWSPTHANN